MICKFCDGELEKYFIRKFDYWTIYLAENQYYLGRVYVVLNRHGPEKTIELTKGEWNELKEISDKLTIVLASLYKYDLAHYIISQMRDRYHFHMHLIPRYENVRNFYGEEFKDEMWGKPPFPTPKREFSEEILMQIKGDIKKHLK
ncbi:hypothetical protein HYT23_04300 [Candidatus Pacearchaeota archaeon]|nr:hypothetical protein [Candidatus Pacearchaeota archaeon]